MFFVISIYYIIIAVMKYFYRIIMVKVIQIIM